jgi:hypothetical protein
VPHPLFDVEWLCSEELDFPLPPEEKAKVDSFLLTFSVPQAGHTTGDSDVLLQIFSNSSSQDEQTNS